jgi:hypothetical protein
VLLSLTSIAYSQQTVINSKGDTLICFSVEQSKFLLKQVYEVAKLTELNVNCEIRNTVQDSLIHSQSVTIQLLEKKADNLQKIVNYNAQLNTILQEKIENEQQKTKYQRNMKRVWMGVSGAVSGLFVYYIVKNE